MISFHFDIGDHVAGFDPQTGEQFEGVVCGRSFLDGYEMLGQNRLDGVKLYAVLLDGSLDVERTTAEYLFFEEEARDAAYQLHYLMEFRRLGRNVMTALEIVGDGMQMDPDEDGQGGEYFIELFIRWIKEHGWKAFCKEYYEAIGRDLGRDEE